ncbi:unnamed protein product [Owenia fusiformis]|uniref:Uncharacterized protein n=1 Tax=Owenia fusiformis TaxID=6347 RepID=A0A8S4N1L8_OWEFU|nr:unnamed protein product [Owenia fusiformis]
MNSDSYVLQYTAKQRSSVLGELLFYRGDNVVMLDLPQLSQEKPPVALAKAWDCKNQAVRQMSNITRRGPRDTNLQNGKNTTNNQRRRPKSCPPVDVGVHRFLKEREDESSREQINSLAPLFEASSIENAKEQLERLSDNVAKLNMSSVKARGPNDIDETIVTTPFISFNSHVREQRRTIARERKQVTGEQRVKLSSILTDHVSKKMELEAQKAKARYTYSSPHYGCKIPDPQSENRARRPSILIDKSKADQRSFNLPEQTETSSRLSFDVRSNLSSSRSPSVSSVGKRVHYHTPKKRIHSGRILRKVIENSGNRRVSEGPYVTVSDYG